ncbi:MAG: hypothetical protein JNL38_02725 [Myxococcales bacterium]|jgi:hypothetical protein|nr:hypothetical protein [Myxococcales bacterium]
MLDRVRTSLHTVLTSKTGDGLAPIRVQRDLARRLNVMLGEPLCSSAELERRRAGQRKLEELARGGSAPVAEVVAAPVQVFFEKDRNARMLGRIEDLLQAKGIAYTKLDVAEDDATRAFVLREAKCALDELPVVFVASSPVGDYNALVDADVSGKLDTLVFGAAKKRPS